MLAETTLGPLLRGAILGFSIAAPVGPIGMLCIQRSLANGRVAGLACGLGAATADAIYGALAASGLAVVSSFLVHQQTPLRVVGGLFLLYLGVRTLRDRPASEAAGLAAPPRPLGLYVSTFLLTLTNPMTILSFVALFAGIGLGTPQTGPLAATLLVTGVFTGSAAWWFFLSTLAAALGRKLEANHLRKINFASGAILIAFALWQFWQLAH